MIDTLKVAKRQPVPPTFPLITDGRILVFKRVPITQQNMIEQQEVRQEQRVHPYLPSEEEMCKKNTYCATRETRSLPIVWGVPRTETRKATEQEIAARVARWHPEWKCYVMLKNNIIESAVEKTATAAAASPLLVDENETAELDTVTQQLRAVAESSSFDE